MVWRRQSSTSTVSNEADQAGLRREPVRPGDTVTNVNQPTSGYRSIGPSATQLAVWRAQRLIYYIFGVVEAFIAIRFILKVLAANPSSLFTQWMYNISWVFVFPFNGVVPNAVTGASAIEWFSLIALVVYALVSVALANLIGLLI